MFGQLMPLAPSIIEVLPDNFTSLLLHFDGDEGSTSFIDSSIYNQAVSRVGTTAKLSANRKKFGKTSLSLSGSGSVMVADAANLRMGTGDFTIDLWAWTPDAGNKTLIEKGYSSTGCIFLGLRNSYVSFYSSSGGWTEGIPGPVASSWNHYAIVRRMTNLRIYINGVMRHSRTDTTNFSHTGPVYIGAYQSSSWPLVGNIDEVRMSKGIARWTENFTPPDKPYRRS